VQLSHGENEHFPEGREIIMGQYETFCKEAEAVGTWMIITGFLVVGPVGFVVLGIFAYAMYVSKPALAWVCLMLLACPLALMLVWIPLLIAGRSPRGRRLAPGVLSLGRTVWKEACRDNAGQFW